MRRSRQAAVDSLTESLHGLHRTHRSLDDAIASRLGIGSADVRCLDHLRAGPSTAGDLGRASGVRPAATTAMVDRLVDRGFVRRAADPHDRRRVLVELTAEGSDRLLEVCGTPLSTLRARMLAHLPVAELDRISEALDVLRDLQGAHRDVLLEPAS